MDVMTTATEPMLPSDQDARMAKESSRTLAPLLRDAGERGDIHLRVAGEPGQDAEIRLPRSAARLLLGALQEMAKGHGVAMVPIHAELTTQEAADLLRVSRPFLIKMLDAGKLPFRRVGAHRRVLYADVARYAQEERRRREGVLVERIAETARLGLYES